MPHADSLILTLVGGFVLAFVFGMLAHRLKLSPLVGYLVAGVLVGPYTAGAVLSIAFDLPEPLVDGNVARVFARWFAHEADAVATVTLVGFAGEPLDTVRIARRASDGKSLLENGDGVLRVHGAIELPLSAQELGFLRSAAAPAQPGDEPNR